MSEPSEPASSLDTTVDLLARVRAGDVPAREQLVRRFLPILRRWAHSRLPSHARDLSDTDDLVQVTLTRVLSHVGNFEPRREGAFLAYLRKALLNVLRNEVRRSVVSRPGHDSLSEELVDPGVSVIEQIMGRELLDDYESALAELPEEHKEAIILRIEFGYTHQEIADALGKPTANAARMTVTRALERLAEILRVRRA